jgi:archaemetzincin
MGSVLGESYPFLRFIVLSEAVDLPNARIRRATKVQYRAEDFIPALGEYQDLAGSDTAVGLTAVDLYVPDLNFVFGLASPRQSVAIISTHRLEAPFYGLPAERSLLLRRVVIEAAHELGHLLCLGHCRDRRCVMFFSNSILDTDAKGCAMCPRCRALADPRCKQTGTE